MVDGPAWLLSSTRAEAQGLLAGLMAMVELGWNWGLDLRLDNDGAVARAGGLMLQDAEEGESGGLEDLRLLNADIWEEMVQLREAYRAERGSLKVEWHPGHPERRKDGKGRDWDFRDRAIFRADLLAERAYSLRPSREQRPDWPHKRRYQVLWRGGALDHDLGKQLGLAVRVEQLTRYVDSVRVRQGGDGAWCDPVLLGSL